MQPKKVKECGVLCRGMFASMGLWWQSFRYRRDWNEGYDWLGCWIVLFSSLGLFAFYVQWSSSENVAGKRMEQGNDPEKWHLRHMTRPEWEHCRCLSGTASRTWLVQTRRPTWWKFSTLKLDVIFFITSACMHSLSHPQPPSPQWKSLHYINGPINPTQPRVTSLLNL